MIRLAIIGLGSWGLAVLERLIARSWAEPEIHPIRIDVVEPGPPGAGVHRPDLSEHFLLNTPCGQINLFGAHAYPEAPTPGLAGPGFFDWLNQSGYRVVDGRCRRAAAREGRPVRPDEFLPRHLLGKYLQWVYRALTERAPPNVQVVLHQSEATDIRRDPAGRETVELASGTRLKADYAFLTTGHARPEQAPYPKGMVEPYPESRLHAHAAPGSRVGVAGLGLVAVDVVTALTQGRGGRFETAEDGRAVRYRASGREPHILLFSRSGLPFCCRPVTTIDRSGGYDPAVFTLAEVERRRRTRGSRDDAIDFRADVLPPLFAEMQIVFFERHADLAGDMPADNWVRPRLAQAWQAGDFARVRDDLATHYGRFDPGQLIDEGAWQTFRTSSSYEAHLLALLRADIAEAEKGEAASPWKAAAELFRVMRETLRACVDDCRLAETSHTDFFQRVAGQINRVIVGPPVQRGHELLALVRAGVVSLPLGPAPRMAPRADAPGWRLSSTRLQRGVAYDVDALVAGYLPQPTAQRTAVPLLGNLHGAGRIRMLARDGGAGVAGIDVTPTRHPIGADGGVQDRLFVLGPPLEGARYFNHYIPSPGSRRRAFHDAEACVARALERHRSGISEPT